MRVLFVGEKRSAKAVEMNVTWKDRRLASKHLFDAFESLGVNTDEFKFCNELEPSVVLVAEAIITNTPIVAMGRIAQKELSKMGVSYHAMIHPAARGRIRNKQRYAAHVREVLKEVNS